MTVHLSSRGLSRPLGIDTRTVRRRAERILDALEQSDAELSILLCDDDRIASLNESYRAKKGPTDVLSFGQLEGDLSPPADEGAPRVLGDVVISLTTAARQAPEGPSGLRDEVTRLLAHGTLHLLGWVHDTDSRREAMHAETERLMSAAGAS